MCSCLCDLTNVPARQATPPTNYIVTMTSTSDSPQGAVGLLEVGQQPLHPRGQMRALASARAAPTPHQHRLPYLCVNASVEAKICIYGRCFTPEYVS